MNDYILGKCSLIVGDDQFWGDKYSLFGGKCIHPKSEKIGGDYLSAQKNWRKNCVNLDDKILRQKGVNHQNVMNFVTK